MSWRRLAYSVSLRRRGDLATLATWLREREYWSCQYAEYHPGFRTIYLLNGDTVVGRVICIMPSLFDEALHAVRINIQVVRVAA